VLLLSSIIAMPKATVPSGLSRRGIADAQTGMVAADSAGRVRGDGLAEREN
jgi:hypothetical protein